MIKRTNGKQMAHQQYQLLLGALDEWRLQTAPGAHVPPNRGWAPKFSRALHALSPIVDYPKN